MKSIEVVLLGWNVTWSMVRKPVTSKSPPDRSIAMFALVSVKIRKFLSGHGMAVWASILQSTADIRHLYRFAKEIHQKKAKSMVFQYSKYLLEFNKISPIPNWKKPKVANLMSRTSKNPVIEGGASLCIHFNIKFNPWDPQPVLPTWEAPLLQTITAQRRRFFFYGFPPPRRGGR